MRRCSAGVLGLLWSCLLLCTLASGGITCRHCHTQIQVRDPGILQGGMGQRRVLREVLQNSSGGDQGGGDGGQERPGVLRLQLITGSHPGPPNKRGDPNRRDHRGSDFGNSGGEPKQDWQKVAKVRRDQPGVGRLGKEIMLPTDPNEEGSLISEPKQDWQKVPRVRRDQHGVGRLGKEIMLPTDPNEEDHLTSLPSDGQKVKRSEAKGSREEVRLNRARMEELKLNSTSFPLTGDSAHNQAMVHWTGGHNSSVILILTKLYDFNLGSVTESSLWRSTDYGTTYEKFNEKVGLKTVLSYLYVSPTNKKKIMLLSDPDMESSILISSDAGATYQKYRLNFYIQSLLFHPKQEDWVLAYSLEQKLYSSMDFGRRWHLMHERITPNRFYWSVMGLDKEPDLVHMEARTADGHAHYITCRIQECSETTKSGPFSRFIDTNSLVVQDEYVFIQATSGGRASYYVSYKREAFAQIKLPKYSLPKDMHIISTDEKQVFSAVQEWNQNETYNLYISDTRGVYFTLALENVRSSRGLEGNIAIDLYEVAGIKGVFLANKKVDERVKTFITYNKGRDWRLLQAPDTDLKGNPINCLLPFCSLHFNLQMSENPYNSGSISSKATAPWLIVAAGNVGPELSSTNTNMFISSDGGNTWKHIFEEEYNVWFLDWGGALVAMKHTPQSVRHLWLSFDEGRSWTKYGFTSSMLFVDGALVDPGVENQIMTVFGHFSLLSEWQLVKVDYKSIFGRKCSENDFENWHLHNQRDFCVMGERKTYRKRRPGSRCLLGKDYLRTITEPCICSHWDFECDYGYERHGKNQCTPAFWFNPTSILKDCGQGQSYLKSSGYRRIVSNNCTDGLREQYSAKSQPCLGKAPQGLQLTTSDGKLGVQHGQNVTFLVHLEEGDLQKINIQLDFGDGSAVSYANFSKIEDGIRHFYKNSGIYQVTAYAENNVGIDSAVLYLHVTVPVEHVHLRVPFVTIRNKEVNVSAMVWPSHPGTLTYFWWIGNNTKPLITLDSSISLTFSVEGTNAITVQVSSGSTLIQDTKEVAVHEYFQSQLLSFSPNLDFHNPDIPEWRQDISRLVKKALTQVTHIPEDQVLVAMFPGLPTSAELFILPPKNASERRKGSKADLEQIVESLFSALNQNLIMFELKPGVQIFVYVTQLTLAPLVDNSASHSSSAMLMLLSIVFVGLAVFLIYKFKRKIPWINIYAQVQHDKEQEMIGSVSQNDNAPKISLSNFTEEELADKELDQRIIGSISTIANSESTKEIPNCTSV